jgi:hypothetical protein
LTDTHIEEKLIIAFLTLNEFSGEPFIEKDEKGNLLNVALPNVLFTPPKDNQFFVLSFLPNEPEPAGLGTNAENRWSGLFQIDIIVPLGAGMEEPNDKYNWIVQLFQRGKTFDEIMIIRTYRAAHGAESTFYRTIIRVEFTATLPK